MTNSKLIELLKTFATRDYRRFREYLTSPYFNKRQDLVAFYAVLESLAPEFPAEELEKEVLWRKYAPEVAYEKKTLTYLANFLLQKAENYLAIERLEADPTAKGISILSHYLDYGMGKHFRRVYDQTSKALQDEPYRDSEWHLKAWRLADARMQHFYSSRVRKADSSISRSVRHLDAFYLDEKLEISSEILNLNQILQEKLDDSFMQEFLAFLDKQAHSEPTVNIRRLILNILLDPEDSVSFQRLRSLLSATHDYFPPDKVKGIFAYAQNFCIRRIKAGDIEYELELFRIYKEALETQVMYEAGILNPWNFKNICSISLKLGEYGWTHAFIQSNQNRIPAAFRSSAVAYNLANLHFHQGQFDQALRALMKVEFSDVFYALDTRRMMLMIYFEQGEIKALSSLVSSFKTFLQRNRVVSETNRIAYKNFVDWLNRIFRERSSGNPGPLTDYALGIRQTSPIVESAWLLKQCGE